MVFVAAEPIDAGFRQDPERGALRRYSVEMRLVMVHSLMPQKFFQQFHFAF